MAEQPLTPEIRDHFFQLVYGDEKPHVETITGYGNTFEVVVIRNKRFSSVKWLEHATVAQFVERLQAMEPYVARRLFPDANAYR